MGIAYKGVRNADFFLQYQRPMKPNIKYLNDNVLLPHCNRLDITDTPHPFTPYVI